MFNFKKEKCNHYWHDIRTTFNAFLGVFVYTSYCPYCKKTKKFNQYNWDMELRKREIDRKFKK